MKNLTIFLFSLTTFFLSSYLYSQTPPPVIEWQKSFGTAEYDVAYSIHQTFDTGYIIAGTSAISNISNYWIVKTNDTGAITWQNSFGAPLDDDYAQSVWQNTDSGYVVAGYSFSVDSGNGLNDYWIIRLNKDGGLLWTKRLGGAANDSAYSVQQTADGGFIVAGSTDSQDGDVTNNHGNTDGWIVKLDGFGGISWQVSVGGSNIDVAHSVAQTFDEGYIVAGYTFDTDSSYNYWIIKLTAAGTIAWQKFYGGLDDDEAYSIQQTADSGFIVAGKSLSLVIPDNNGNGDYWVLKLDPQGNAEWKKSYGGTKDDFAYSVQQTSDGSYIVAGKSASSDSDVIANYDKHDYWIVKLESNGDTIWEKNYGGTKDDVAFSIDPTSDGGYIIGGWTASSTVDVTQNFGLRDFWIVKLESDVQSGIAPLADELIPAYPNPAQDYLIIDAGNDFQSCTVEICDAQGRIMSAQKASYEYPGNKIKLHTSHLPDGFYLFYVINNKTGIRKTGKFMKQTGF